MVEYLTEVEIRKEISKMCERKNLRKYWESSSFKLSISLNNWNNGRQMRNWNIEDT